MLYRPGPVNEENECKHVQSGHTARSGFTKALGLVTPKLPPNPNRGPIRNIASPDIFTGAKDLRGAAVSGGVREARRQLEAGWLDLNGLAAVSPCHHHRAHNAESRCVRKVNLAVAAIPGLC